MDLSSFVYALLLVCALGVLELCSAASRGYRQQGSSRDYQYGYHYESQSSQHSYSEVEDYDVPVEPVKCYHCEYTVLASQNHEEGVKECNDPFSGELGKGVWEMECAGPCSKKYEYKGENSFTIRRSCVLNCKERSTKDGSYTMCCTGNLCNGFSSSYVVKDHRWLLLAACVVSVLSTMLRI